MLHAAHTAEVPAPTTAEYAPTIHDVHELVPVLSVLYRPAAHTVHTNDVVAWLSLPYLPAPHAVQTAEVLAATKLEYAPVTHDLHALVPVVSAL